MNEIQFISELVDEIALEKPLDWESFNYDAVKEVAVVEAVEKYYQLQNESEDPKLGIMSIMAYLMMENTQLWIELRRIKTSPTAKK